MQSKATNITAQNNIGDLSVSRAASNAAAALSALCGGSGVGQAPELPQKAAPRLASPFASSGLRIQKLPHSAERAEFKNQKSKIKIVETRYGASFLQKPARKHVSYEIGKKEAIPQEKIIQEKIRKPKKTKIAEVKTERKPLKEKKRGVQGVMQFALAKASYLLLVLGFVGFCFTYGPVITAESRFQFKKILTNTIKYYPILTNTNKKNIHENSKLTELPDTAINEELQKELEAVNFPSDMAIVIPKIEASSEFVPNVDAGNYEEYMEALRRGVAHAQGTALPGMEGNAYFFAHSAGNLFDIARFNAVFYLITKLEKGDAIYVKFGNERFKYTVFDKREVNPADVGYLTRELRGLREVGEIGEIKKGDRILTLQTCIPPGTDWRRLLVFARIEQD